MIKEVEESAEINVEKNVEKNIETTVETILNLIILNPRITQIQLAKETNFSRRGVEFNIKKLKEEGILKRIGPDKNGYWEVVETPLTGNKTTQKTTGKTRNKTRNKIIEHLKAKPEITSEELSLLLIEPVKNIEWHLIILKEENQIRRIGSKKTGHWEVIEDNKD